MVVEKVKEVQAVATSPKLEDDKLRLTRLNCSIDETGATSEVDTTFEYFNDEMMLNASVKLKPSDLTGDADFDDLSRKEIEKIAHKKLLDLVK